MKNDFFDYLTLLTRYTKKDIQLKFLFACFISLLFIIVMNILLKKIPVTDVFKKQYLCNGFLISLIYNFISPYISVTVSHYFLINTIISIAVTILIIVILTFIESMIVYPLASEKSLLKKYLICQGISIPIFSLIINIIVFLIILLISSFISII